MACNNDKFKKNLLQINKVKILDNGKILTMPDLTRYEFLYFLEIK